jgi:hypothetical protein
MHEERCQKALAMSLNVNGLHIRIAALCRTMNLTITEAAERSGINRRTIQRWIKNGLLEKDFNGGVSMQAIKDAANKPKKSGRPLNKPTEFLIYPEYCGKHGLKRLRRMLVDVGYHHQRRGDFDSFVETLATSLGICRSKPCV